MLNSTSDLTESIFPVRSHEGMGQMLAKLYTIDARETMLGENGHEE
jgi:hypothetical protein